MAGVDAWLADHFIDDTDASPAADQYKAAAHDAETRIRSTAPYVVASKQAQWALIDAAPHLDPRAQHLRRSVARAAIAAEWAGIVPLCGHTRQARPMVLHCDPPVVVCSSCLAARAEQITAAIQTIGFRWGDQCDRCGARTDQLAAHTANLGHITVIAHVCARCGGDDQRHALQVADQIVPVGRRRPCPCGSGRQYRGCCERHTTTRRRA